MPKLTIEIPDTLASLLATYTPPLPLDDYCRRALEDAATQERERRACAEALLRRLREDLHRVRPSREDSELFTVPEAAKLLRLSPNTVRKMIKEGKLPTADVGHRTLVPWGAISRVITHVVQNGTEPGDDPRRSRS